MPLCYCKAYNKNEIYDNENTKRIKENAKRFYQKN